MNTQTEPRFTHTFVHIKIYGIIHIARGYIIMVIINVTNASATGTLWPVREYSLVADFPAIFFHISHWYHLHTLAGKRILSCDLW